MKKLLFIILLALSFVMPPLSAQAVTTYNCNGLTGGTQRDLDYLSVSDLNNGDRAIVLTGTIKYHFKYDSTATNAENVTTHPFKVRPDDYATAGVWIEQELATGTIDAAMIATGAVDTAELATGAVTPIKVDIPGLAVRGKFTWSNASDIYIQPFVYDHQGTTNQLVYSSSSITYRFGSGGSNGDSEALVLSANSSDWFYLYIDDSAIITAGTNVIAAAQLLAVTEEPVWSNAKHGHYGSAVTGNATATDRCIGAFRSGLTNNILEFFHDGDLFLFSAKITASLNVQPSTTWTDSTQVIPIFSREALVWIEGLFVNAQEYLEWRTNGQTSASGHRCAVAMDADDRPVYTGSVFTDSAGIIELRFAGATTNTFTVHTEGWRFGTGM